MQISLKKTSLERKMKNMMIPTSFLKMAREFISLGLSKRRSRKKMVDIVYIQKMEIESLAVTTREQRHKED